MKTSRHLIQISHQTQSSQPQSVLSKRISGFAVARRVAAALAVSVLAIGLSACAQSSSKVATIAKPSEKSSTDATEDKKLSPAEEAKNVIACLRKNGLPTIEDAPTLQQLKIPDGSSQELVQKAFDACSKEFGASSGGTGTGDNAEISAKILKVSSCMRENGFPEFPDPTASGMLRLPDSVTQDPKFQSTFTDCNSKQGLGIPGGQ